MKAEVAMLTVSEVMLKAQANTAKGQFVPGDFVWPEQCDLKAFLACCKGRRGHFGAVKKMNLIDMGNADQRERGVDTDPGTSFLEGFPVCGFSGGFTILHESRR